MERGAPEPVRVAAEVWQAADGRIIKTFNGL
jgi:hypothetical protein